VQILFGKQEEEDLVTAHRRQVEETIDIVREVCTDLIPFSNDLLDLVIFLILWMYAGDEFTCWSGPTRKSIGWLCFQIEYHFITKGYKNLSIADTVGSVSETFKWV